LRGLEFSHKQVKEEEGALKIDKSKDVVEQIDILIKQATNHENLASCYIGWCPYW
jgi:phosphatidylinositol kinase/protein kinase (PI-3  family)